MNDQEREFLKYLAMNLYAYSEEPPEAVLAEAKRHAVQSLMSTGTAALSVFANNVRVEHQQKEIASVLTVPYVILKGSAAAMYYPEPARRALGDIDILPLRGHFEEACQQLLAAGYSLDTQEDGDDRHIHLQKNGVLIELHQRYASFNTKQEEELLDGWIFDSTPRMVKVADYQIPVAPEPINGLILLNHISYHLEGGLGIRQIIDWVMYVKTQLPDEKWEEFKALSDQLGLTTLAKVTARLGQLYLSLPTEGYSWCTDVDESLCTDLMDYIFESGNFGRKGGVNNAATRVLSQGNQGFFRNLQLRGEENWKALKRHPGLKCFAWLYQAFRYVAQGLKHGVRFADMKNNYSASRNRNRLMRRLNARQQAEVDKNK